MSYFDEIIASFYEKAVRAKMVLLILMALFFGILSSAIYIRGRISQMPEVVLTVEFKDLPVDKANQGSVKDFYSDPINKSKLVARLKSEHQAEQIKGLPEMIDSLAIILLNDNGVQFHFKMIDPAQADSVSRSLIAAYNEKNSKTLANWNEYNDYLTKESQLIQKSSVAFYEAFRAARKYDDVFAKTILAAVDNPARADYLVAFLASSIPQSDALKEKSLKDYFEAKTELELFRIKSQTLRNQNFTQFSDLVQVSVTTSKPEEMTFILLAAVAKFLLGGLLGLIIGVGFYSIMMISRPFLLTSPSFEK